MNTSYNYIDEVIKIKSEFHNQIACVFRHQDTQEKNKYHKSSKDMYIEKGNHNHLIRYIEQFSLNEREDMQIIIIHIYMTSKSIKSIEI